MPRRVTALLAVVALVVAGAACGGDDETLEVPAGCTPIEDGEFTLIAENLAWNVECLVVPVGTTVSFTVDNRDESVQHNLSISGKSGRGETPIAAGPVVQSLVYEATTVGKHLFLCDPHAGTMRGDLWVVEPTD